MTRCITPCLLFTSSVTPTEKKMQTLDKNDGFELNDLNGRILIEGFESKYGRI